MRKDEIKKIKIYTFLACFTNILLICLFSYLHYKKYHYVDKGQPIAKVNNVKIYRNEVQSRMDFLAHESGQNYVDLESLEPEVLKAVLMEIYTNDLIVKLAKKENFLKNNNYRFLAKEYYNRLLKDYYINNFVLNDITEENLKREYDRLVEKVKDKEERKISHILVATEDEINRIRNTIIRKNNFEKIAEQKSLDKPSAINGGSIGYVIKEEIVIPEFANIAFMLKKDEISRPIHTKEGWHLIKVDDIRKIKMKTFEESKEDILRKLRHKKFEKFINDLLKKHNNEVNIEIIKDKTKENNDLEKVKNQENTENNDYEQKEIDKESIIENIINNDLPQQ